MYVCGKRAVVFAWLMDKWLADSPPPLRLKGCLLYTSIIEEAWNNHVNRKKLN